jgi:hypothetical protein
MLDDFREQASTSPFFEDESFEEVELERPKKRFLGMTPAQRFVIALMLLMMTCLIGALLLVITERVVLPPLF